MSVLFSMSLFERVGILFYVYNTATAPHDTYNNNTIPYLDTNTPYQQPHHQQHHPNPYHIVRLCACACVCVCVHAAYVTSALLALLNHSGWRWETASPVLRAPAEAGVDLLFNFYK